MTRRASGYFPRAKGLVTVCRVGYFHAKSLGKASISAHYFIFSPRSLDPRRMALTEAG